MQEVHYWPSPEILEYLEMMTVTPFIEKRLKGDEPARCVDGRPSQDSKQGPQMLGGSFHPILLKGIFARKVLDKPFIAESIETLEENGSKTGVHQGEHAHEGVIDCGFADRIREILAKAVEKRSEITKIVESLYKQNQQFFENLHLPPLSNLLNHAFDLIDRYPLENLKVSGEPLIKTFEKHGSTVETVEGDHGEEVAFINFRPDYTLDTRGLNMEGGQGFNLDLKAAVAQSDVLGAPLTFSIPASLILYVATEMVLVEDKGKPRLPIEIHV